MKRILNIIFSVCFPALIWAGPATTAKADSAYTAQNYELAIQLYSSLLSENYHSATLYYNLGNAYFKSNELGEAIWAYHKAQKIDPSRKDIAYNLQFASGLTKDKIEYVQSGIGQWFSALIYGRQVNFWAWVCILFSVFAAVAWYLYRESLSKSMRSIYVLGLGICFSLMAFSFIAGISQYYRITSIDQGIVTDSFLNVYTAPQTNDTPAFELHEGARFEVLAIEGDWIHIELNKNQGWVEKDKTLLF